VCSHGFGSIDAVLRCSDGKCRVEGFRVDGQHLHVGVQISALTGHPLDADGNLTLPTPRDGNVDACAELLVLNGPDVPIDLGDDELPGHGNPPVLCVPNERVIGRGECWWGTTHRFWLWGKMELGSAWLISLVGRVPTT